MFRSATSSTEYQNEPRIETGNAFLIKPSYQNDEVSPSDTVSPSRPLAESAMIAREIREGTLSAFVGAATKISAEVSFKSLLRIDGLLSGRITSDEGTLVVAAAGRVEANVTVAIARINGTVTGDIVGKERIELGATAKVTGNIHAPTLIIEPGAVLDGRCRMTTPQPQPVTVSETDAVPAESVAPVEIVAAAQVTDAAAVSQKIAPTKTPKIARKGNVMNAKTKRARTKGATAKTADGEAENGEKAAVAAG